MSDGCEGAGGQEKGENIGFTRSSSKFTLLRSTRSCAYLGLKLNFFFNSNHRNNRSVILTVFTLEFIFRNVSFRLNQSGAQSLDLVHTAVNDHRLFNQPFFVIFLLNFTLVPRTRLSLSAGYMFYV